ncbi:MAG: DUF5989 family protein [Gemmatimonadota bacterium]|jgi:hypothetical protein
MGFKRDVARIWGFLKARKLWWISPIVILLLLLSLVIVLVEGSALAPFIYTLF